MASMHDVAANLSEENQQVVGALLGQTDRGTPMTATNRSGEKEIVTDPSGSVVYVPGTASPRTYLDRIEANRSDPEFNQYRREYSRASEAAIAAGAIPPGGTPPPGAIPPIPPPPGP
jgi:hypothetical protein